MGFLINIFMSLGIFIEAFVTTYTIEVIGKILSKRKESIPFEKIMYCTFCIYIVYIFNQVIFALYPDYSTIKWIVSLAFIPVFIVYFFRFSILTSVFSNIIEMLTSGVIELLFFILLTFFKVNTNNLITSFMNRLIFAIFLRLFELSIVYFMNVRYIKKHKLNINDTNSFVKYMIPQFLALSISLFPIMTLIINDKYQLPMYFILINFCQLLIISIVSLYNINNVVKQKDTEFKLANMIVHNETLLKVNDGVRGFKHDMSNIVQAMIGYMAIGDMEGAKKFCQNLVNGFNDINILSILSPEIINDPAIYGVVVNKILVAREKEMSLSLDINLNVSEINFPKFELSRILGILIDNAIEAGDKTKTKKLILDMHTDYNTNQDIIKIANSIDNLDIDVNKVFDKDFSTKKKPSGFGLYEVRKFLSEHTQGRIYTKIDDDKKLFSQTIYIDKLQLYKGA